MLIVASLIDSMFVNPRNMLLQLNTSYGSNMPSYGLSQKKLQENEYNITLTNKHSSM
jgi:hypothetical protein